MCAKHRENLSTHLEYYSKLWLEVGATDELGRN